MDTKPLKKDLGIFDKIVNCDWELIWSKITPMEFYRTDCDDGQGTMVVCSAIDGDAHIMLKPHPRSDNMFSPSYRARTFCGGGRNERTRIALMLLAIAIQEDAELDEYEYRLHHT